MAKNEMCRLCANEDEFSKDLLHENNKNLVKIIKDLTKVVVYEDDNLPTKICLNCEEKIVSFQLFVLECYKIQDKLRKKWSNCQIKPEDPEDDAGFGTSLIKSEVKDESAEDIDATLVHNKEENSNEIQFFDTVNDTQDDDDVEDEDDLDNLAIASLKRLGEKKSEPKVQKTLEEIAQILKKPNLKIKDLFSFDCDVCGVSKDGWPKLRSHCVKIHKCEPTVHCLCGTEVKSKSNLYKHVQQHKTENTQWKESLSSEDEKQESPKHLRPKKIKTLVKFNCLECETRCTSWYSLKSHCEKEHQTQPVVYCACGIMLKSKSVMYKHVQDHQYHDILACDQCPRVTTSIAALNKHKMRHIPKSERKYKCSMCDKILTTKEGLKSHEKSHIPIEERKIYHCEHCTMKFTTRSSLSSHTRIVHEKIKSYICDLCGYACGTNGELRQHRAIHSDNKPFVCNQCSKSFKTYSNLKTHMDTHGDTSYECYICRRVLNSRRTLRKHLVVHEDHCRHVCPYCNKGFKRRQTLKVHMYTHTGDKPLTCKWCEERFSYASTLRAHRIRCHTDKMAAMIYPAQYDAPMVQNYIKNDVNVAATTVNPVAKNEVEVM